VKALVTRPREDAAVLVRALAARGVEPVLAPLLNITPTPDAQARLPDLLAGAQALLFTSANGVRAFAAASERRELPVFAVGDATAAAARIANFRSVHSAGGDVADLAELVAARLAPTGGALVHGAGSVVAGDLAARLDAQNFAVRRAQLYEAVPATALDAAAAAALARGEVALALFFSPRTAATFVRLAAAAAMLPACRTMTAIALSPAVAAALAPIAWRGVRIAAAPTQGSLLATLDALLSERAAQPASG
jgi:uroporphyrinogen-III synthase